MTYNSKSTALRIITLVYCVLYFGGFIFPILIGDSDISEMSKVELYTVPLAFFVFLTGTIYIFKNEKVGGIIILFWHFLVWCFSLLLWPDAGMVLVLIFPMIFPAIFMIRNWYIKNYESYKSEKLSRWKLTLRIFLINYTLVYLLVVFSNTAPRIFGWNLATGVDDLQVWSYSSFLGLSLIFALALYIFGFVISWRSELMAGIIFIVWYLIILFLSLSFPEFANSGPAMYSGLTILVQGVLYVVYYYIFMGETPSVIKTNK